MREHDAAFGQVVDIERIEAYRDRRKRLQTRRAFDHRGRDLRARTDGAVGILERRDECIMIGRIDMYDVRMLAKVRFDIGWQRLIGYDFLSAHGVFRPLQAHGKSG